MTKQEEYIVKMMNAIENGSRGSVNFRLKFQRNQDVHKFILEGNFDKKIYKNTLKQHFNLIDNKYELYKANGRKNVLELFNRTGNKLKSYFIVDRDYKPIKVRNTQNLIITPCYSCENLLFFKENLSQLFEILGIPDKLEKFRKHLDDINEHFKYYCAWKKTVVSNNLYLKDPYKQIILQSTYQNNQYKFIEYDTKVLEDLIPNGLFAEYLNNIKLMSFNIFDFYGKLVYDLLIKFLSEEIDNFKEYHHIHKIVFHSIDLRVPLLLRD